MHPELFNIPGTNIPISGYGAMVAIAFLGGTFWMVRIARRLKADEDIILNLAFLALIFSTIGAHTFYVIHYWDSQFAHRPWSALNPFSGGFEFYGGFIGAFIACFLYLWLKKLSIRLYADIITPGLLFGMGVGRIGCFLHGCCWGAACDPDLTWAVHFPVSSPPHVRQWENRQVTVPEEFIITDTGGLLFHRATDQAGLLPRHLIHLTEPRLEFLEKRVSEAESRLAQARESGNEGRIARASRELHSLAAYLDHLRRYDLQLGDLEAMVEQHEYQSVAMHPSQLYQAVGPLILALFTHALIYRRQRHGIVLAIGYGLYAIERFVEEGIRNDSPLDTFGLTVSQGVSIGILAVCILVYLYLRTLPLRSPYPARPRSKENEGQPGAQASPVT